MSSIVVVSNRVPVPQGNAGQAGGLAVALLGLMQRRGGLWFGWSGAVTETAAPPGLTQRGGVGYATIDLTRAEHRRLLPRLQQRRALAGASTTGWTWRHFDAGYIDGYRRVNQLFARKLRAAAARRTTSSGCTTTT